MIRVWQVAVLLVVVAASCLRAPSLLHHPRFWAEEGAVYFAYAYKHGVWQGLLAPQRGYYNFIDNLAAVLAAKTVPLEWAPVLTMTLAMAIQLIPYALVLWLPGLPWTTRRDQLIACALILFAQPSAEIWLNTLCSQFHLTLVTCLLLLADHASPRISPTRVLLVAVAGLSGPVSAFLSVWFIVKAVRERSRAAAAEAAVLTACAIIGCVVALRVRYEDSGIVDRLAMPSPNTLVGILVNKSVVLQLFGRFIAHKFAHLTLMVLQSGSRWIHLGYAVAASLILVGLLALAFARSRWRLLPAYLTIMILSIVTSQGVKWTLLYDGSGRYYFAANIMVLLGLFMGTRSSRWRVPRVIFLVVAFAVGVREFRPAMNIYVVPGDPDWREEVRLWRMDGTRRLHNPPWPQADWSFSPNE
jgi:hypothetical protein